MSRPKALDLFCGAGGVSKGLDDAGFEVWGVDIESQPNYVHAGRFVQANALAPPFDLSDFDFIWASPPCLAYTPAAARERKAGREYPDLIEETRNMLSRVEAHTAIENVPQAPLRRDLVLNGTMFPELRVIRKRIFELNFFMFGPSSRQRPGRVSHGGYSTVCGGGRCSGVPLSANAWHTDAAKKLAMGIDWMKRKELANAIPPAYAEFIGREALRQINERKET